MILPKTIISTCWIMYMKHMKTEEIHNIKNISLSSNIFVLPKPRYLYAGWETKKMLQNANLQTFAYYLFYETSLSKSFVFPRSSNFHKHKLPHIFLNNPSSPRTTSLHCGYPPVGTPLLLPCCCISLQAQLLMLPKLVNKNKFGSDNNTI